MIDRMRKRVSSFIYTFIIFLIVAVMAFVGVGQLGNEKGQRGSIVAKVNSEVITREEFENEIHRRINQFKSYFGGQLDEKMLEQFQIPQRTLEEMIQMKLMTQQARKLGFEVTDYELIEFIRTIPQFQKDGKFDVDLYNKIPNRGPEEKLQRDQLVLFKFQNYLKDRFHLTPSFLSKELDLKETKLELEYAILDPKEILKAYKPNPTQIQAFLKSSAGEVDNYYQNHKLEFMIPPQYRLRRIRAGFAFKANDAQKAEAKKKIETAFQALQTGKSFAAVAQQFSDDEYAKKGGDQGWVNKGAVEPNVETAIENLKPGANTGILPTEFGYFIYQLAEKKEEQSKPLASVQSEIAAKLIQEKEGKTYVDEKKLAYENLMKSPSQLSAQFKKDGIEVKKTGIFSLGQGYIPNLGNVDSVLEAVYQLTPENPTVSSLLQHNGSWYYVKLLKVERPKKEEIAKEETQKSAEMATTSGYESDILQQWVTQLQKKASVKTYL